VQFENSLRSDGSSPFATPRQIPRLGAIAGTRSVARRGRGCPGIQSSRCGLTAGDTAWPWTASSGGAPPHPASLQIN